MIEIINAEDTINRMKEAIGVKTNTDLANFLCVAQNTISGWKSRQTIPIEELAKISYSKKVSVHWLMTGEGEKFVGGAKSEDINKLKDTIAWQANKIMELEKQLAKLATAKESDKITSNNSGF